MGSTPRDMTIGDFNVMLQMLDETIPVCIVVARLGKIFILNRQPALVGTLADRVLYLAVAQDAGPIPQSAREQIAHGPLERRRPQIPVLPQLI